MITKKKKFSRKEIKEDKLVSFVYKAQSFYEDYKNKIFTYGTVIVVAVALAYFYVNQKRTDNENAGVELSRTMILYDQGTYLQAIEGQQGSNIIGLKKIVEDYGGTENGESAKIFLANSYSFLGNYDEALKYYEDYSGSIDYFKAAAISGRAGYYASKNNYEEASDLYLEAAGVTEVNAQNSEYLLKAGINLLKAGNKEEAKILFETIREKYSTSLAGREIGQYLALVN
jgi:tetratricopeptide (TPR) repeat protein